MPRLTATIPRTSARFLIRLFRQTLPLARRQIAYWQARAEQIPHPELRGQALASIGSKRFHADGGCVYAAASTSAPADLVKLIVAFQTISDYLDNLCDRCDTYDEADFHQLHHAMRDAVRPGSPVRPYYALRGHLDDGGYLAELVHVCQTTLAAWPSYPLVAPTVSWLVERYCELQAYKHIQPELRQQRLMAWWSQYETQFPELHWWEFAAATGSTLGVFCLFQQTAESASADTGASVFQKYFPWICGLHILLDYLIDLEEDVQEGDFNFVQCYETPAYARERIRWFARRSWHAATSSLKGERIHRDVVTGLLGMYLSDQKVTRQREVKAARRLLWEFGPTAWLYYGACVLYRKIR